MQANACVGWRLEEANHLGMEERLNTLRWKTGPSVAIMTLHMNLDSPREL
jgi:hypothetical protein